MRPPFDHFDLIAGWYDQLIRRPAQDRLAELLAAEPGQLVLDVGGGTGRNSQPLLLNGVQVVVCDFSTQMIRQAHRKGLATVLGSAAWLPFASACADRVLVVDAFHHFVAPTPEIAQELAAAELIRVLKPGGRLIIEEPDIRRWPARAIALGERLLLMGSRFLAVEQLVARFQAAGARYIQLGEDGLSVQLVFEV